MSSLSRRAFVGGLVGLGKAATGLILLDGCGFLPKQATHVPRIGFVFARPWDARQQTQMDAFVAGLHDYGYLAGQNLQVDWRFSASQTGEDVPAILAELIALPVDLLATSGTPPTQAAKQATSTIPIVGVYTGDPVATGLVQSLARPAGNVTAVSNLNPVLSGKRLEMVRALVLGLGRIGYVYNIGNAANVVNLNELRQAAEPMGITVQPIGLRTLEDLGAGVDQAVQEGVEALAVANTGSIPPTKVYAELAALAQQHGLPSMGFERTFPELGGLMSNGAEVLAIYRRAAYYVDRILRGANPADLPVEQPTVFELVVNRTTAQALQVTIPPDVAAQATEWVQ